MTSNSVKSTVDAKIKGAKVLMVSKSYCGFCAKTKKLLAKYKLDQTKKEGKDGEEGTVEYEIWEIDSLKEMEEIQNYLAQLTKGRSVPRVFIDGKCVGGADETAALESAGKLKTMLGK